MSLKISFSFLHIFYKNVPYPPTPQKTFQSQKSQSNSYHNFSLHKFFSLSHQISIPRLSKLINFQY